MIQKQGTKTGAVASDGKFRTEPCDMVANGLMPMLDL
jgi:hypothetical protein